MKYFLVSFIIISFSIQPMFAQNEALQKLLPEIPENWSMEGDIKFYNTTELYDYINGGAELYLSYGMEVVISQLLVNSAGDEIRLEIFDMAEPKNAFGVFTHTRTSNKKKYGQGSQGFTGAQIFWKNKYFVSVIANDENVEINAAIDLISISVDNNIKSKGEVPGIISLLPETEMVQDGFVYFHHYIWLNSFFFLSNENILNINRETDAVIAKYGDNEHRYFLLLVEYPTATEAKEAQTNFRNEFEKDVDSEIYMVEENKWQGAKKLDNLLMIAFACKNDDKIKELFSSVKNKYELK